MPEPSALFRRALSLALPVLFCSVLIAEESHPYSAFEPELRSGFSASLLEENASYLYRDPNFPQPGFSFPFSSWKTFTSSVLEAFSPGPPKSALARYAFADSSADFKTEANILTGYEHRWDDPGDYGFLYKGFRGYLLYKERLRLRGFIWNGMLHGSREYWEHSPLIDGFTNQNPNGSLLDNLNGEFSYRDERFTASLGRGKYQIASSISGSLILSDRVNEYDNLLLEARFGKLSFSFLNAILQADSLGSSAEAADYPLKLFSLHQFAYAPLDQLRFFIGETAVYGNRFDVTYLLPFYYWRVGKYNLRDRDNLMIYCGADWQVKPELGLYLNLALDELTVGRLFTGWWGNKYALQTGAALDLPALALVPAGIPRVVLEFTAVKPWTYTHYANVSMYSHDRRSLGYPKGSNLLDITAELNLPLPAGFRWDSQFSCTWQGSEGSDWRLNYLDYFPPGTTATAEAHWLDGDISFRCRWQNALRIGFFAHHTLLLGHASDFGDDPGHRFFGSWQFCF